MFIVPDQRFYQKSLENCDFFFKIEIFQIQNFPKFHHLLFNLFYVFFSLSPIHTCQKIVEIFVMFYWMDYTFYQRIMKNSRSLFKNIQIWEINFFLKLNSLVFIFYFFSIFDIFISISSIYLSKNSENFYGVLFYELEILSKNFGKSWNIFLKKYRYSKCKILHKFHHLQLLFQFLAFLTSVLFLFHLSKLVKKFRNFCGLLLYRLQILLENFGKFLILIKKNRVI